MLTYYFKQAHESTPQASLSSTIPLWRTDAVDQCLQCYMKAVSVQRCSFEDRKSQFTHESCLSSTVQLWRPEVPIYPWKLSQFNGAALKTGSPNLPMKAVSVQRCSFEERKSQFTHESWLSSTVQLWRAEVPIYPWKLSQFNGAALKSGSPNLPMKAVSVQRCSFEDRKSQFTHESCLSSTVQLWRPEVPIYPWKLTQFNGAALKTGSPNLPMKAVSVQRCSSEERKSQFTHESCLSSTVQLWRPEVPIYPWKLSQFNGAALKSGSPNLPMKAVSVQRCSFEERKSQFTHESCLSSTVQLWRPEVPIYPWKLTQFNGAVLKTGSPNLPMKADSVQRCSFEDRKSQFSHDSGYRKGYPVERGLLCQPKVQTTGKTGARNFAQFSGANWAPMKSTNCLRYRQKKGWSIECRDLRTDSANYLWNRHREDYSIQRCNLGAEIPNYCRKRQKEDM